MVARQRTVPQVGKVAFQDAVISSEAGTSSSSPCCAEEQGPPPARFATDPVLRVGPNMAQAAAQEKAQKMEQALEGCVLCVVKEGSERSIGRADSALRIVF